MDFGPYLLLASLEGAVLAAVLALTAVGLSLVFGVMRVVNVAHGEFFMLGAVLAWWVTHLVGGHPALGFALALVLVPVLVGLIAVAADMTVLKRIDYDPERTIVATIGILYIIQQVTLMTYGPDARPVEPPFNTRLAIPWIEFVDGKPQHYWPWGLSTTSYKLGVIAAAAVVLVGVWLLMARSKIGLLMRATQLDRDMALAFGIPVERIYAIVFGLGAGLAAMAAVLIVPIQQAHYLMGGDPLLLSFIVVIIGGLGSLPGTVVAAILIGLSDGIISVFFSPTLAKILATLLVALVLVFRPQGLFGVLTAMSGAQKSLLLHTGVLVLLLALQFVLPAYHHGNLARIMVLASYAIGYNILFGYTGLLSLGHALFFAAGMYGMGLAVQFLGASPAPALVAGLAVGLVVSAAVGALALRTAGVAFMIVTLMFAQAGFLTVLYFGTYTRGDEGFVIQQAQRSLWGIDLSDPTNRYFAAFVLFATCLLVSLRLVRTPFGRVLIAIRENEDRARMLGYDVFAHKLAAVILSGTMSALAGAVYGLLFGYVGATFASVQYSIFPLLWVLLGGAGTILGPLIGTLFMFYLIDLSSQVTSAYMLIAGVVLVGLTLFAPQGLAGELRARLWRWLP